MANHLYKNDLPNGLDLGPVVAIDCETMGLNPHRDRLCVIQMSGGDGNSHIIQVDKGQTEAPNLSAMLENPDVLKLFHFGRFDIAAMYHTFGAPGRAGLLHQDRQPAGAHLHRPSRAEEPVSGTDRRGYLETTADERLGR